MDYDEAIKHILSLPGRLTPDEASRKAMELISSKFFSKKKEEESTIKQTIRDAKTSREGIYDLAKQLSKKFHVKTIGNEKREIYIYKDGIYILGQKYIMAEIQDVLQEVGARNKIEEILAIIKNLTVTEREDFVANKYLINLNNGVLDIKSGRLEKHSPVNFFFTKVPINYDPKATCPKIEKALNELLPEDKVQIIYQWLGYALFRDYFIKKAIIFVGEKNTGKSTVLNLFTKFMGLDNISGVSLQQIGDKFAMASLYNKSINIVDDLSFDDINNNGAFKTVTGNGLMTAEYKFGNRFNFANFSKLTFACNKIPSIKDVNDDAYFSRWIVIRFDNLISKINKFLLDDITEPKELSGLLNLALVGLDQLMSEENFTYNKTDEEIKIEMVCSGSSIAQFAYDKLEISEEHIFKDDMYETYSTFCHKNKLPVETKEMFGRKIRNSASYMIESRTTSQESAKQKTVWRNVRIK